MKYNLLSKLSLKDRRGYTLLFAVIVSVLVLSVGAFIVSISRKQFVLASASRDSVSAFYAADSGLECAIEQLYAQPSVISTTTIYAAATAGTPITITCGGATWTAVPASSPSLQAATTTWQMSVQGSQPACATIAAYYHSANADGTGATSYYIDARGYNIGWDSRANPPACNLYGPRRVERALRYVLNF